MIHRIANYRDEVPTPFPGVRVYRVDLGAARADYLAFLRYLSVDERERAGLYRQAEDRLRFVVTRAVLRLLLADAGLGSPEMLTIVADGNGKPELPYASGIAFNVSHAGEVALVALAEGRAVGIDVETVRERADLHGVAQRFFSIAEVNALARYEGLAFLTAFHRCWVRKEACIKGAGLGLRAPLDGFTVGVDPRPGATWTVEIAAAPVPRAFEVADLDVRSGYAAALAVGAPSATA